MIKMKQNMKNGLKEIAITIMMFQKKQLQINIYILFLILIKIEMKLSKCLMMNGLIEIVKKVKMY